MSQPFSSEHNHPQNPGAAANGWLVVVLVILIAVLAFRTVSSTVNNRPDYTPRVVVSRGELGADEKATIEVFQNATPSVVFVRSKGFRPVRFGVIAEQELASGTGFVWDEEGHIITNLHVVRDAVLRKDGTRTQLEVQLADSTVWDAQFIGAVYKRDIAVLKIAAKPSQLTPITVGKSSDLKVGQKVLAIGNPFGFDRTLSTGVIGGLDRSVATGDQDNEFLNGLIQTDAAINPGNSGGPLLDSAGLLIGVNTAIVSTSGASAGLGFAVPVDDVLAAVDEVMQVASQAPSAELGVGILDPDEARSFGIPEEILQKGPIIRNVYARTAAAEAGLVGMRLSRSEIVLGDLVLAIDGKPIRTGTELQKAIRSRSAGDVIILDILRGTQTGQVSVTLKPPMILL
ncbi:MAG: trypsin-like peptidase domain-containing protein [Planctomycetaceae bacterium]|nr:trypsin-like peptidase domain-containing protein [Planctomycetaceae bacterium]